MLSPRTKKKALAIKKIAEEMNPKRQTAQPTKQQGTYGVKPNNRPMGS
jgi:hypothetical protein